MVGLEKFWRSVDLTGNQTLSAHRSMVREFWRSVDLTGNQTRHPWQRRKARFWRSVDLTGNQTKRAVVLPYSSFGAVLI